MISDFFFFVLDKLQRKKSYQIVLQSNLETELKNCNESVKSKIKFLFILKILFLFPFISKLSFQGFF